MAKNILLSLFLLVSCFSCSNLNKAIKKLDQDKLLIIEPSKERQVLDNQLQQYDSYDSKEAKANKIMIATEDANATQIGLSIYKQGGNIFDVAIAISFALAVLRPQSTGLGGGGFMLFHTEDMKTPLALDFREKAPIKAFSRMFEEQNDESLLKKSLTNIWASAVPGMVAGLMEIHSKYGHLPLAILLNPSIQLALNGFSIDEKLANAINRNRHIISRHQATMDIFFKADKKPLQKGDLLVQKDLAQTLREIVKNGRDGLYKGTVAELFLKEQIRQGGLITEQDLTSYFPKYRKPVVGEYKGNIIYSMSPPSSGGIHIIQLLNILELFDLGKLGIHSADTIHLMASAMQLVFADRAKYLGDTDFVKVPIEGLISKTYAKKLSEKIPLNRALKPEEVSAGNPYQCESDETNHFTIMDAQGNVITSTQSINGNFGSGIVVPGTGIILNSQMDDFSARVGAHNLYGAVGGPQNTIAPAKRPLSSMSPTIIFNNAQTPVMALGTAAGTRILTCIMQTILNYFEFKLPLYESVMAMRIHHQWHPDQLNFDAAILPPTIIEDLIKRGHKINYQDLECRIQAITNEQGILKGVSDLRGEGLAKGI